jgi:hypothetical protein
MAFVFVSKNQESLKYARKKKEMQQQKEVETPTSPNERERERETLFSRTATLLLATDAVFLLHPRARARLEKSWGNY